MRQERERVTILLLQVDHGINFRHCLACSWMGNDEQPPTETASTRSGEEKRREEESEEGAASVYCPALDCTFLFFSCLRMCNLWHHTRKKSLIAEWIKEKNGSTLGGVRRTREKERRKVIVSDEDASGASNSSSSVKWSSSERKAEQTCRYNRWRKKRHFTWDEGKEEEAERKGEEEVSWRWATVCVDALETKKMTKAYEEMNKERPVHWVHLTFAPSETVTINDQSNKSDYRAARRRLFAACECDNVNTLSQAKVTSDFNQPDKMKVKKEKVDQMIHVHIENFLN